MRIVHIVTVVDDDFSLGGPLTVALQQCRALRALGHDVVLAGGWRGPGRPPTELEGVPVAMFRTVGLVPPLRFSGLLAPGLLVWLLRNRQRFEVAHLHFARDLVPLTAAVALQLRRVPFATQTHGMVVPDPRRVSRVVDRVATVPLLRRAATRFVLTERERDDLAAVAGAEASTAILPNGVDTADHSRIEPPTPDVLFLARLHPRKRVLAFARAAVAVLADHGDARFSIVGPDDGDATELQTFIAAETDIRHRLVYEGPLVHSAAVDRIGRASIYVLPSVDEPFPMTMLEALSLGVPVITTWSNGLAAALEAAGAAVLVPDDEPEELARAIDRVLRDHILAADLSSRGARLATDTFGMRAVARQLEQAYEHAATAK